jgi:hypothetical protein
VKHPSFLAALATICALLVALGGASLPVHAQATPAEPRPIRANVFGVVVGVHGPVSNPDGVNVQLGSDTTMVRIEPGTVFEAQSAEAQVEGLAVGDYVCIPVRRVKGGPMALRIRFDVVPVPPLQVLRGTMQRFIAEGTHFTFRTDDGRFLVMRIWRDARLVVDGRVVDGSVGVTRGTPAQIICAQRNGWVAYEIDLRPASVGLHAGLR